MKEICLLHLLGSHGQGVCAVIDCREVAPDPMEAPPCNPRALRSL